MKLISLSTLLFLWMTFAEAHPLHLSITNIVYENGKLNISMKTFPDDWETAYFHFHGQPIDFSKDENRQIPWLSDYLKDRFYISKDKGNTPYILIIQSIVMLDDTMEIVMWAKLKGNPNSLYIYNALLTDIFPDQTNLVIFEFKEKETGIKFDVRNSHRVVVLK